MKQYEYFSLFCEDPSSLGVCKAPDDVFSWELFPNTGIVHDWVPIDLFVDSGEWTGPLGDYQPNDLSARLCSSKLMELINSEKSAHDNLQWLPAIVHDVDGTEVEYFILHLPQPPDVLDEQETIYDRTSRVLIRPTLSLEKAAKYRIVNLQGLYCATIVHTSLKKAIELAGLTGMEFSPVPCSS